MGMRGGSSNVLGSFLRYEQHACLLVEMLARPCGARLLEQASWWRRREASTSGTGSGEGAGARVAVRSVLKDHETAILELERQVECLVNHLDLLEKLVVQLQDIAYQTKDRSLTIAELGMKLETRVDRQVSVVDMFGDQGAGYAAGGGGLGQEFHRVGGRPRTAC